MPVSAVHLQPSCTLRKAMREASSQYAYRKLTGYKESSSSSLQ